MQSEELTAFYRAYAEWLDDGAPNGQPFFRSFGLCSALDEFLGRTKKKWQIKHEMLQQFEAAGLHANYPFGYAEYYRRMEKGTVYLQSKRVKWVREHAK